MDSGDFRRFGYELVDWIADYLDHAERYPVLSRSSPGQTKEGLPAEPPMQGERMEDILADFREIIVPGITHWQHPRFFAYFPATTSGPSILGELLSAGLGVNAMLWQTSPAATELEEVVMDWLRSLLGLPEAFRGVIQDTASTATLCALICARERATDFRISERGIPGWAGEPALRLYTSTEGHSSVEKGARIAGFGSEHVVTVRTDEDNAMNPENLRRCIEEDRSNGLHPCCVVATVGTTSSTAIDPLGPIGVIAENYGLWLHVDAALAGSAAILPEKRWILDGVEKADSFVFNPHKWLFTNFDCSAFYCRHPDILTSALSIQPEYLKTGQDCRVVNFRDWGIQLGRRFRSLKLWFVLRYYGVEGLQERLREHIGLAAGFASWIERSADFELMAPVPLNTVCFRYRPVGATLPEEELEAMNRELMDDVNRSGRIYITHTRLRGTFCLRLSIGQMRTDLDDVKMAWEVLQQSDVVETRRRER
ncbi:MAG: aspartate aminotransferase family protein [bacterium]|nr:MAG: aspartate aminotransferase family protein [bacterium]